MQPDTRESLLIRLHDTADEVAWREFLEIYRPLIYRTARSQGLQEADAEDVVQQVLLAVMGAVGRWKRGEHTGSFRCWLFTITRNLLVNFVARQRLRPVGGTSFVQLLEQQPASDEQSRLWVEQEYRAQLFRWAAAQVRPEFQPATWEAFWRTAVGGESIMEVARELKLSVGSIYAARSRVMNRLKRRVRQVEEDTEATADDQHGHPRHQ
jgi:RNA polymerase sigma factor (sigma-70 family)